MVTDGSASKSASSSVFNEITSIGGLSLSAVDDTGVPITVSLSGMAASGSSTPISTASIDDAFGGVAASRVGDGGDGGDERIASRDCEGVRTLIVTRLERPVAGSASSSCCSGVVGMVGSESIFMAESLLGSGVDLPVAGELGEESTVSTERLRESLASDVRRRFRDAESPSSKGLGRVEQGSEETARSLDGSAVEA